jgi:hypothetical protein
MQNVDLEVKANVDVIMGFRNAFGVRRVDEYHGVSMRGCLLINPRAFTGRLQASDVRKAISSWYKRFVVVSCHDRLWSIRNQGFRVEFESGTSRKPNSDVSNERQD